MTPTNGMEKLTPVYVATYILANVSGDNHFEVRPRKDRHGITRHTPTSLSVAVRDVERMQEDGLPAYAHHYGWKERGFRKGEKAATIVARNELCVELDAHPEHNHGAMGHVIRPA